MSENRIDLPCGCWRAVTVRKVLAFYETDDERRGQPMFDTDGNPVMKDLEGIDEGYCEEHGNALHERQIAVQKYLADGGDTETAMKLMLGEIKELPALEAHKE